jgi:predicted dehydrogenase
MVNKIKWGVLGAAQIAMEKVIPAMQKGQYSEIFAIASRDISKSKKIAEKLKITSAYGSYEELLEDKNIDAVYIPLPNHLHVEWSIKCMEAGKHVLCEKPLALTTEEIKKLIEVRDRTGMKISEAFMVRSHPQWIKAREMVQNGTLGDLKAIQGFFSYFNRDAGNIRNIQEYGGGSIWDIGCYPINTSRLLFNEEPTRVIALMENDSEFKVDRLSSAILDFPSGQAVFTSATQLAPYQRMTAFGTEKYLEIEIPFNSPMDEPTRLFLNGNETIKIETCDQYTHQGDNFSLSVINNSEVPVTLEDSLNNTAVINALFESAKSGTWKNVKK